MSKFNRRTRVVILTIFLAVVLAVFCILGMLIPDEAVTGSFLNAK